MLTLLNLSNMKKSTILYHISAAVMLFFTLQVGHILNAQTNAPSVKTGVTFQWSDAQANPSNSATLQSVSINGSTYDQFIVPTGYEMTQLGPNGHSNNRIQENGGLVFSNSSFPGWDAAALAAFQDLNLNHYFESNNNGANICNNFAVIPATPAQKQSLIYNPGITSNTGGIVAITERNANNCYHIAVFGEPSGGGPVQLLGQTFVNPSPTAWGSTFLAPSGTSDYWFSGRVNENNGTIGIAIFQLSDIAPLGSTITRVQLTASTGDHGDGKFFIMQSFAMDESETTPINTTLNDDAGKNDNVPFGSNYTVFSGPSNGSLMLNTDGTFTYAPNPYYVGTDSFVYQVCLPAPNDHICDMAIVTIQIVAGPINFYPALGPGTLAFEDLWPARGDYDFNDLVIDYQFMIESNLDNYVDQLTATFTIQAFGASFENGFGFQLPNPIDPAHIQVSGYSLTEAYITKNPNGTEAGQALPTVIVFDNAFNEMAHPGMGIGVNTEQWAPYVDPETIVVEIVFEPNEVHFNDLDISNFNPFLIVNQNRAVEVHLPGYPPTDLADQSMFGMLDDATDPVTSTFYVTENNLPWAIDLYEKFDWPIEKQDIIMVHLKFAEWAVSGGVLFPNWYQNITGYRNTGLIYTPPSN